MDELLRSQLDTAEVIEQLIDTGMVYKAANDATQIELIRKSSALATHSYDDELVVTNANANAKSVVRFADDADNVDINTISRLQEVDGHQFVVIDPAITDINILLESFIGEEAIEQLQWQTLTHGEYSFQSATISADNSEQLTSGTGSENESLVTLIILNPDQDGIEQISAALAEQTDITALHILSHGSESSVQLGNADLSNDNIENYHQQLLA
jgi:hypothetical protein